MKANPILIAIAFIAAACLIASDASAQKKQKQDPQNGETTQSDEVKSKKRSKRIPMLGGPAPSQLKKPKVKDRSKRVPMFAGPAASPSKKSKTKDRSKRVPLLGGSVAMDTAPLRKDRPAKPPQPKLASLAEQINELEQVEKQLRIQKEVIEQRIESTPESERIKQLKYQTTALEIEQDLEQVRQASASIHQQVAYMQQTTSDRRDDNAEKSELYSGNSKEEKNRTDRAHDKIQTLIDKANHIQSAVAHLHEAGMNELADELANQSYELRREADRVAEEHNRRAIERRELEQQRRHIAAQPDDRRQRDPAVAKQFQNEMIGAIRELNQAVRELRNEMQQMRDEMERR